MCFGIKPFQRRKNYPLVTNDQLREEVEAGNRTAAILLERRLKRYASAAMMNKENMTHPRD